MGHQRRDAAQAFDPAQRLRQGEDFQRRHDVARVGGVLGEFQADQLAEPVLLTCREGMAGMACQAGIVDPGDPRIGVQPSGHFQRALALGLGPQGQGAQAAQGEIAVEGGGADTDAIGPPGQLCHPLGIGAADHATDHVGMPVEQLGDGLNRIVSPPIQWPLQDR